MLNVSDQSPALTGDTDFVFSMGSVILSSLILR